MNVKREITVRVVALDARDGNNGGTYTPAGSGGYSSAGAKVGPEIMADTIYDVERHLYRPCDIGVEVIQRVTESFQHLGYFCAHVDTVHAQPNGKNQYNITIHVHPGEKYRLSEITFTGMTAVSADELKSEFHLKPNSLFNTESVRKGLENIQKACAKKGLPNVTATPVATVDEKNKTVALDIKVQESAASQ
jgi:outer membrane translocation and assembly module TamA